MGIRMLGVRMAALKEIGILLQAAIAHIYAAITLLHCKRDREREREGGGGGGGETQAENHHKTWHAHSDEPLPCGLTRL